MLLGILLGPGRASRIAPDQILQVAGLLFGELADGTLLNRLKRAERLGILGRIAAAPAPTRSLAASTCREGPLAASGGGGGADGAAGSLDALVR